MPDDRMAIKELKEVVKRFRDERDWREYHTPKNLAVSISIEAAELLELFQWKDDAEIGEMLKTPSYLEELKGELSDILIYCLAAANALNIDLSEAVVKKVKHNSEKYPIEKAKGRYKKYTEL